MKPVWPLAVLSCSARAGPFVAVAGGQVGLGQRLHGGDGLARRIARRRRTVQHHRPQVVVAHDRRGGSDEVDIGHRLQRQQLAARRAHAHPEHVVDVGAVGRVGLHLDLPGAAEQVEVVGVAAAQRRLHRREEVGDADAQRLGALTVELEVDLRRRGAVGREHAGQLRRGLRLHHHARARPPPGRPAARRPATARRTRSPTNCPAP